MISTMAEAKASYEKALTYGKKDGGSPLVLDDIFKEIGLKSITEYPLGVQTISLEQIIGTKNEGRSNCFSRHFYPTLKSDTEFASKWISVCKYHLDEGISSPIKVYEYLNDFYVLEGNKRVSVSKYYDTVTISADVIRIIPPLMDRPEILLYYEFLDFYNIAGINYIYFTKSGSFMKLQRLMGKERNECWTDDDRIDFNAVFTRFQQEYKKKMGQQSYKDVSDAFLAFISIYDYSSLIDIPIKDLQAKIAKFKPEFDLKLNQEPTGLQMDPVEKKTPALLEKVIPKPAKKLKVAFVHDKSSDRLAWTFDHEQGRMQLEKAFPENVITTVYNNTDLSNIEEILETAVSENHTVIFTTSPIFLRATLKAALEYPTVKFLNASTYSSFKHVRTYHARMYEVKFLMGAIAGAMASNNKVGYIADCPVYGTIANINAFALGAKMINPRVQVFLQWSDQSKRSDGSPNTMESIYNYFNRENVFVICDRDSLNSGEYSQRVGLYKIDDNGIWNMAMPISDWAIFYEKMISNILNGNWKTEENLDKKKSISYWWGMSSGIVDIISSGRLPIGTSRLIELLKETISSGHFNPFTGMLFSQDRVVQTDKTATLNPEQILTMDWLAENIVGTIPSKNELTEPTRKLLDVIGLDKGDHIL